MRYTVQVHTEKKILSTIETDSEAEAEREFEIAIMAPWLGPGLARVMKYDHVLDHWEIVDRDAPIRLRFQASSRNTGLMLCNGQEWVTQVVGSDPQIDRFVGIIRAENRSNLTAVMAGRMSATAAE
jgi:hypothetical protein